MWIDVNSISIWLIQSSTEALIHSVVCYPIKMHTDVCVVLFASLFVLRMFVAKFVHVSMKCPFMYVFRLCSVFFYPLCNFSQRKDDASTKTHCLVSITLSTCAGPSYIYQNSHINHYDEFIPSRWSRIFGPHLVQNLNQTITQTYYFILWICSKLS